MSQCFPFVLPSRNFTSNAAVSTRIASWAPKEKTPTPASDVLRDAKDAPLEGLSWIHGFIPSSPLLFKRRVRCPELRKIVPLANTTIYEMEQRGEFPRRFFLTSRCVVLDLAEVEAWIEERRRASDAASIQRAPTPDVRKRKTRPVRHQ
jgi:prophage regulatory protein